MTLKQKVENLFFLSGIKQLNIKRKQNQDFFLQGALRPELTTDISTV